MISLTELIKNNYAYFDSYRQGFLYYHLAVPNNDMPMSKDDYDHYQFTVPTDDVGGATLGYREKAITLMRWVRKAYDSAELVKINIHERR